MKRKWYKKISVWLTILFAIVVVPLLILFTTIMIKTNLHPNLIPDFMGYKPMIVLSGSMETEVYTGDLAIVKMVDAKTLKKNDIIAFRNSDDTATLHRIVDIVIENDKTKFVTKGDNNNTIDALKVDADQVEGIYIYKISDMGNVLMFLQKPLGLIISCSVILCIGITLTIILSNKHKRVISDEELKEFEEYKKSKSLK